MYACAHVCKSCEYLCPFMYISVYLCVSLYTCVLLCMSMHVCVQCPCTVRVFVFACMCVCVYVPVCVMNSSKLRAVELIGDKEELTIEFKAKVARSCTPGVHELRTLL